MFSSSFQRSVRPLAGAFGLVPYALSRREYTSCDGKPSFAPAVCIKNEPHTADTRLITFKVEHSPWTSKPPIANVVIKAAVGGKEESGCCACCKCPPPCGCPKGANGCCGCCKCPGTCGCPKKEAVAKVEAGCCACCKCPAPCSCPKGPNGCCACCKCPDSGCGCPKKEEAVAKVEAGCCACCKCPPPCSCPKGPNGCCACCKCPDSGCGCPKKEAASSSTVARNYNPLSVDSNSDFTILVKKYKDSKMGTKLHSLKAGDQVEVRGPNQQWTFEKGKYNEYCMIAGGTGITPLMQATQYILQHDGAKVKMVTFNKTPEDVLLREQLASLAKAHPNRLTVVHYVEGGEKYQQAGCKQASKCCISRVLKEELPQPGNALIMICGRKDMTEAVAGPKTPDFKQGEIGGHLKALGYQSGHVWKV